MAADARAEPFTLMADDQNRWARPGETKSRDPRSGVRSDDIDPKSFQPGEGFCKIGRARQEQMLGTPFSHPDRKWWQARIRSRSSQKHGIHAKEGSRAEYRPDVVRVANTLEGDRRTFGSR